MTLNELVAVEVMGYTAIAQTDGINSKSGGTYYCNDRLYWFEDDYGLLQRPYKPSTWIGDAWEVVEKMKERGWHPSISDRKEPWCAFFYKWQYEHKEGRKRKGAAVEQTAETAPLAICLAALRAVGVSEERIGEACK